MDRGEPVIEKETKSEKDILEKELDAPDFHFKMPKFKMGGKVKKPKAELELGVPEGGIDVELPKAEVDVSMPSGKVSVEKEHHAPDLHFDLPKLKFGGKVETAKVDLRAPEIEGQVDVDAGIIPTVAVKAPAVDVDVPDVSAELPHVEAKADIAPMELEMSVQKPEMELGLPEVEVGMKMPSGKVSVEKELHAPEFYFKMPKFKRKKPKSTLNMGVSEGGTDVELPKAQVDVSLSGLSVLDTPISNVSVGASDVLLSDFPDAAVSSTNLISSIHPSEAVNVKRSPYSAVGHSPVSSANFAVDSFDVIEKDLDVPSYSVRMFKDHPSPGISQSLSSPDHEVHFTSDVTGRDGGASYSIGPVGQEEFVPPKPRRQFFGSEKSNQAVDHSGRDGIDGTSNSPGAFISHSHEVFGASSIPPHLGGIGALYEPGYTADNNSSSDITASELESSSQGESMTISPRDFYAHSATPEFKRIPGAGAAEEAGTVESKKKAKNILDWFRLSWRSNKRRRSVVSTSSGVEDGRSPSTTGKRQPKRPEQKGPKSVTEDEDLGIQADIAPITVPSTESASTTKPYQNVEPTLPREAELILAEQKTAQVHIEASKSRGSKALPSKKSKSKKRSEKRLKAEESTTLDESDTSTPRMRKPSNGTPSEHQRQTWHHPQMKVSSVVEGDRHTPPPPPPPVSRHLDDEISEWLSQAYQSHYAEGSPLRKPRPWSTLDFPPRNCTFLNDDYLFPYSITPTKLPSCHWKSDKDYNVPYIDDDALPMDEPEWALGESRRTLTLTSADADFWRSAIAEEEKSDASGEGGWGAKRHSKKYKSLIPFYHKEKSSKEYASRRPRLLNPPPTEGRNQDFRKETESTHYQETPQTHY